MKDKEELEKAGAWIVRNVPREVMLRTRMAALLQRKTVRQLLMDLVQDHLHDLERKGMLPKSK